MDDITKDLQYDLNRIIDILYMHDSIYRPIVKVSYVDRDTELKRTIKYEPGMNLRSGMMEATIYKDKITSDR